MGVFDVCHKWHTFDEHLGPFYPLFIAFMLNKCLVLCFVAWFYLLLYCSFCAFRWFSSLFFFICSIFVVVGIGRGSGLDFGDPLWWKKLFGSSSWNLGSSRCKEVEVPSLGSSLVLPSKEVCALNIKP